MLELDKTLKALRNRARMYRLGTVRAETKERTTLALCKIYLGFRNVPETRQDKRTGTIR